ncbi:MAG TPA: MBOAT family O-acyltransferase [Fibrobacteria bacterium]|nr:MBOAT family O-acyltransferase [Fibrobacteria bacterium]
MKDSIPLFFDHLVSAGTAMAKHALWLSPMPVLVLVFGALAYHSVRRVWFQNLVLLGLGFAAAWFRSPLFMGVMLASSIVEWVLASRIFHEDNASKKSTLLWISIGSNLLQLVFLHTHFIVPSLLDGTWLDDPVTLLIAEAPSFWLFSKITLSFDAYRGKFDSAPRLLPSLAYMTLFARLNSAGIPIDRARDTLPQLNRTRNWNWSMLEDSGWVALHGLLKLTASHTIIGGFYQSLESATGFGMYVRCWVFAFDTWLLLSGGIDIAIAGARLFGIEIRPSFDAPFLSRNIAEFWQRWSITVGAWLNEEVFTPLSFAWRNLGNLGISAACFVTFIGCGLAHEVNWPNFLWGVILGGGMAVYLVTRRWTKKFSKSLGNPKWLEVCAVVLTMHLFVLAEIPDGENMVAPVLATFKGMVSSGNTMGGATPGQWVVALLACGGCMVFQIVHRRFGGDFWMRSFKPLPRIAIGVFLVGLGLLLSTLVWA